MKIVALTSGEPMVGIRPLRATVNLPGEESDYPPSYISSVKEMLTPPLASILGVSEDDLILLTESEEQTENEFFGRDEEPSKEHHIEGFWVCAQCGFHHQKVYASAPSHSEAVQMAKEIIHETPCAKCGKKSLERLIVLESSKTVDGYIVATDAWNEPKEE